MTATATFTPAPTIDIVTRVLAEHAAETEREVRPAPESVEALRAAGLFALGMPEADGGASVSALLETLTRLATACPASAWVTGTCAVSKRFAALSFGPEIAAALIAPEAPACGSGQPQGRLVGDGGELRLEGRWRWISGCQIAEVAVLGARTPGADPVSPLSAAIVPVDALRIEPDWDVAGMRGTGSHAVVAEGLPVSPTHHTPFAFAPAFVIFSAVSVAAPVLGAAAGALELARERVGDSRTARACALEATQRVDDALVIARAVAQEADSLGASVAMPDVTALRSRLGRAVKTAVAAFDPILDLHGASGFRSEQPVQRLWRDASVGSRHPLILSAAVDEQYAEQL
jgi:alkylation response protein AidB-like acyl-CoA dehydrogenase